MSGRIIIANTDGSPVSSDSAPQKLYVPDVGTAIDRTCGTYGLEDFAACPDRYVCGALDTKFEKCLQAIDCKMHKDMYSATTPDHHDLVAVFSEQMVPHHTNAVNMARLLLIVATEEGLEIDADLEGILYSIIHTQNYQVCARVFLHSLLSRALPSCLSLFISFVCDCVCVCNTHTSALTHTYTHIHNASHAHLNTAM
jgi:hypothetical protein